ncbi:MAG: hypothetical protein ACKN9W_13115 [Methylococcus sp.]
MVLPRFTPLIRTPWLFLLVFLLVVLTSIFLASRLGNRHIAEAFLSVQTHPETNLGLPAEEDVNPAREVDRLRGRLIALKTLDRIGIDTLYPDIGAAIQGKPLPLWVELSHQLNHRLFHGSPPESVEAQAEEHRQWLLESAVRRFRGALSVRLEGNSSRILLGYRHHDRDRAIAALGEFLKVYQEARQRLYAPRQARRLRLKLAIQRSRLEALDLRIASIIREASMQKQVGATAAQTAREDELGNKIRKTQQALGRLEEKLRTLRGGDQPAHPSEPTAASRPSSMDPAALAGMRETLMNLERMREQIRARPYTSGQGLGEIEDKIKSLKNFLHRHEAAKTRVESVEAETLRLQREIAALHGQLEVFNQQREKESDRQKLEFTALRQQLEAMQKEPNALEIYFALTPEEARQIKTLRREREELRQTHTVSLAQWDEIERVNRTRRQRLDRVRVLQPPEETGSEKRWAILLSLLSVPLGLLMAILMDRLPWRR